MNDEREVYRAALNRVAAYCSKAERCRWDIQQKLKKFNLSETDKCEILSWLEKEHFLDEKRYCIAFVNDKVKFSRWGRIKIKQALKQKRVDVHLIEEALKNINLSLYMNNLSGLIAKKKQDLKEENSYVLHSKLVKYAMGRGFTYAEIEHALQDNGLTTDFIY